MRVFAHILRGAWNRTAWSLIRYLFLRFLTIGITIFLGVFATVLIINQPPPPGFVVYQPQLEAKLESQIERVVRAYALENGIRMTDPDGRLAALRAELRHKNGLELPFLSRHLLWALKAMGLDWGELAELRNQPVYGQSRVDFNVSGIVLQALPNTILLVAVANLLIFLIGLPLSLYLARHYGGLLDRLLLVLAPLSSVPSWVFGILLIAIFSIQLGWFPSSDMFDKTPPETPSGYIGVIARHMVLPVLAIVLSMLFQLISTWRAYFVIHSQEDYVELARAKGLRDSRIEREYILKPTLPFVITNFSLALVGFWQMTMALEVVFRWPGIGWLYISRALPNYWGESFYPGELLIALNIVVVFAYLLGLVVFLLDIAYSLVDPRLHLLKGEQTAQEAGIDTLFSWLVNVERSFREWHPRKVPVAVSLRLFFQELKQALCVARDIGHEWGASLHRFWQELVRYPTALAGMTIILLMVIGSIYAAIAYPYERIGSVWDNDRLMGRSYVPRLAEPAWTNWFRLRDFLSIIRIDESQPAVTRTEKVLENGWRDVLITYTFDYQYGDIPQEMYLHLDASYAEKLPYIDVKWLTPDGREISLKGMTVKPRVSYDFEQNIPTKRMLVQDAGWQQWFQLGRVNTTPAFYLLFVAPGVAEPTPQHGVYQLKISALHFEPGSTLTTELVLLGHVFGVAGTDYLRRDLLVPLLWGLPFALVFGLLGATLTTLIAMALAATGVWFGGWVDGLLQRLAEANMVLPVLAISVLAYALFGIQIWMILAVIILLNVFGSPAKTFRAAFLQVKEAPYIEAARAYGVGHLRMISHYLIPRILPVLIPQLVTLIPGFIFLEATLGLFNIKSEYPTWGRIIYQGLTNGALYGSRFWVLEPIALLLLTSLAFSMLGIALERVLNPRLLEK